MDNDTMAVKPAAGRTLPLEGKAKAPRILLDRPRIVKKSPYYLRAVKRGDALKSSAKEVEKFQADAVKASEVDAEKAEKAAAEKAKAAKAAADKAAGPEVTK